MRTDYSQISSLYHDALYHYGIKGMKWGIINQKDNPEFRLASEKNQLDYEKSKLKYDSELSQIKTKSKSELDLAKEQNKKTIALGRQQLSASIFKDSELRKESIDKRRIAEKKYATLGMAAVVAALTLTKMAKYASDMGGRIAKYNSKKR